MKPDSRDRAERLLVELNTATREAREALADISAERKRLLADMAQAREAAAAYVEGALKAEVEQAVSALGAETEKATERAVARVIRQFDELADTLLGQDRDSRKAGRPSLPELARTRREVVVPDTFLNITPPNR
ncbi:hypothetical protein ACFWPV_10070 [Streptomyces uncialis]|uniref:hypothetical protein n=1 Tax=Streptomyces uncialis TaxID=1048205 RepID=UPI0036575080